jgi:hypothetical protein
MVSDPLRPYRAIRSSGENLLPNLAGAKLFSSIRLPVGNFWWNLALTCLPFAAGVYSAPTDLCARTSQ